MDGYLVADPKDPTGPPADQPLSLSGRAHNSRSAGSMIGTSLGTILHRRDEQPEFRDAAYVTGKDAADADRDEQRCAVALDRSALGRSRAALGCGDMFRDRRQPVTVRIR